VDFMTRARARASAIFARAWVRYAFALAMVAVAYLLRLVLDPWTGAGAPFVLFFGAMLVTGLLAGVGPALLCLAVGLPVAALTFAIPGGVQPAQAGFQALLYGADGFIIVYLTNLTRRARARDRLSEARTRLIVDLAPDAYFQTDLAGRISDVNRAACELLGYGRDELIGKTILDIVPPEDAPRVAEMRKRLMGGVTATQEWTNVRKDGSRVMTEGSTKILPDGRWLAFVRDISARRRESEQLHQSEERFRLTFEEAPIGIAMISLDGHFMRVNKSLCDILGYSPEELAKLTFVDITHPDDVPSTLEMQRRARSGEASRYQIEKRYIRKDGRPVTIQVSGSPVPGPDGKPMHYIGQIEDITERKRAEEALRQSELKFRRLVETLPDAVLIYQVDRIAFGNAAFARLLGATRVDELVGRPMSDVVAPEAVPIVRERVRTVLELGQAAPPREFPMLRRDGTRTPVETVSIGIGFEGVPSVLVVARDLTDRKRAEAALRLSEAKFSGIVSISADAIISVDEQRRITVYNRGAEKIFGHTASEAMGAPIDALLPELAGHAAEGLAIVKGRRKNGEEFPVEASMSRLTLGEATMMTVACRDVTERVRHEKEQQLLSDIGVTLAATLDYEKTLTGLAQLVVRDFADWCLVDILHDDAGLRRFKVVTSDASKADIARRGEQVVIDRSRPYLMQSAVESRQSVLFERFDAAQLEGFAQDQSELVRAVGARSAMVVPMVIHDQLLGTLTFISSKPHRLYTQRDLRFAHTVGERAAIAVENARLYRSAVLATGQRDQVLGIVAHDLRNPLTAILMHASTMQRRGAEPDRRNPRAREMILRSARRMNRLIQDLLDITVVESGTLGIERAPVSPRQLISDAADAQRELVTSAGLDLEVDVSEHLPELSGDAHRLLQVFENLIGNAAKFTDVGGRITVGAAQAEGGVLFWVGDTGHGITSDELSHVFDRFWQASGRARRLGAGLGLPITRGIVEAHGGRIWVDSTPGLGSTFYFSIPAAPGSVAQPPDLMH
jgi:PAS domain S-box-containing protein